MFDKSRLDYTQELFGQFVRCTEIRKRFGYMCKDATILTTDDKLYNKLKFHDASKYLMNGCQLYALDDLGIELYEDTQLANVVTNAILFKSYPQTIAGKCDYTYICTNNDKAFKRITELLPIVVHHHISKYKINPEIYAVKNPTLNVNVSINDERKQLKSGGSYMSCKDFFDLSRTLVEEIEQAHNCSERTI